MHEQIDAAVFSAYGWPADLPNDQILANLTALNAERVAEEREGLIKWLRPDFQISKLGPLAHRADRVQSIAVGRQFKVKMPFPQEAKAQAGQVLQLLRRSKKPLTPKEIALAFKQGERVLADIEDILRSLNRLGDVKSYDDGRSFIGAAA